MNHLNDVLGGQPLGQAYFLERCWVGFHTMDATVYSDCVNLPTLHLPCTCAWPMMLHAAPPQCPVVAKGETALSLQFTVWQSW